jgi:hypothetical protein
VSQQLPIWALTDSTESNEAAMKHDNQSRVIRIEVKLAAFIDYELTKYRGIWFVKWIKAFKRPQI